MIGFYLMSGACLLRGVYLVSGLSLLVGPCLAVGAYLVIGACPVIGVELRQHSNNSDYLGLPNAWVLPDD